MTCLKISPYLSLSLTDKLVLFLSFTPTCPHLGALGLAVPSAGSTCPGLPPTGFSSSFRPQVAHPQPHTLLYFFRAGIYLARPCLLPTGVPAARTPSAFSQLLHQGCAGAGPQSDGSAEQRKRRASGQRGGRRGLRTQADKSTGLTQSRCDLGAGISCSSRFHFAGGPAAHSALQG